MECRNITADAFKKAGTYIERNGRALEIARFNYEFNEGPITPVLESLSDFQNKDGGFGHALEPDLRAQESSVLCTSIALQTLRALDVSAENPLVSNALEFLRAELNEELPGWRIVPPSTDQSPHAPWWQQEGREENFGPFCLNPTAEILGYLYDYPGYVAEPTLKRISSRVIAEYANLETIEMHDLLCCLRLLKTKNLPETVRDPLKAKLSHLVKAAVCCDPAGWESYNLRPLHVVDAPQAEFASVLEKTIHLNLDYEIGSQEDDGTWTPTWSWGDQYPDDWEVAKREWTGVLTLEKLMLLKRFNRIESTR